MEEAKDDEGTSEYHSFSDSDSDSDTDSEDDAAMTEEERKLERETRAAERQLVLEAAGIVVVAAKRDEMRPPPPLPRSLQRRPRAHVAPPGDRPKRRPPPALPTPTSPTPPSADINKPLPLPRTRPVDDAYERYEAFKQRASVSSFEQVLPASPVSVSDRDRVVKESTAGGGSTSTTATSSSSSYGSLFSQLLARSRSPVLDRETRGVLTISAPIMSASSSAASGTSTLGTPVRDESPGFGSVSRGSWGLLTWLIGCV